VAATLRRSHRNAIRAKSEAIPNLRSIIYAEALEVDDLKHFFGTMALAALLAFGGQIAWAQDIQKGLDAAISGDFETALQEWLPLAEQGHADAQFFLGRMHYYGDGVPQDYVEAVKWYRLAAEQGEADAQANLGVMYAKGEGVIQDAVYSLMWLNISASLGNEDASSKNRELAAKMTAEGISKARECVARDYKGC
jgi:TPR repeat protein